MKRTSVHRSSLHSCWSAVFKIIIFIYTLVFYFEQFAVQHLTHRSYVFIAWICYACIYNSTHTLQILILQNPKCFVTFLLSNQSDTGFIRKKKKKNTEKKNVKFKRNSSWRVLINYTCVMRKVRTTTTTAN